MRREGGTERNGFRRGFFAAGGSIQSKPGEGDGKKNSEGIEAGLNREAINIRRHMERLQQQ